MLCASLFLIYQENGTYAGIILGKALNSNLYKFSSIIINVFHILLHFSTREI